MLSVVLTMWLDVLQFDTIDYLRWRNKVFALHHFHKFSNIETRSLLLQCSLTVFVALLAEGKKRSHIVRSSYEIRTFNVKHPLALWTLFSQTTVDSTDFFHHLSLGIYSKSTLTLAFQSSTFCFLSVVLTLPYYSHHWYKGTFIK